MNVITYQCWNLKLIHVSVRGHCTQDDMICSNTHFILIGNDSVEWHWNYMSMYRDVL